MIVLVYNHEERPLAQKLAGLLEAASYDVSLAPVGFPVGSGVWKEQVQLQIERATAVLALSTEKSSGDEWFNWRILVAQERHRSVIPIYFYQHKRSQALDMCQGLTLQAGVGDNWESLIADLKRWVPNVRCFVSYSRDDDNFVSKLTNDLRSWSISVWRDIDSIPAGASWDSEIEKAISRCSHVLLVATRAANSSPNVIDEIGYALNKKKVVVPVMVEDCELPMRVHRAQWVDFRESQNYEAAVRELVRHLQRDLFAPGA